MIVWYLSFVKKNSYLDEGWFFTGRFKVGNVPGMIIKEVLIQFIYKPAHSIETFFTWKTFEIYYSKEESG